MPELDIQIGGRAFRIACQDGEENHLNIAATLLDREAQHLIASVGTATESRMLLMSGLMLADRLGTSEAQLIEAQDAKNAVEKKLRAAERKLLEVESRVSEVEVTKEQGKAQGKLFDDGADREMAEKALASLSRCTATVEKLADVLESRAKV